MNKKITVLPGDGIGPEIVAEAVKVLNKIADKYRHGFEYTYADIGGCSIDKFGVPITDSAMNICKNSNSVLLGAVGGPKWDNVDPTIRPEKALLAVRKELGLFANLRLIPSRICQMKQVTKTDKASVETYDGFMRRIGL